MKLPAGFLLTTGAKPDTIMDIVKIFGTRPPFGEQGVGLVVRGHGIRRFALH